MTMNYFIHQETIVKNLISFMREKGYSRLSLSKLTDVSRSAIDELLSVWSGDASEYNSLIERIRSRFDLPMDYFIKGVTLPQSSMSKINPDVQELRRGLADILDIYSMYI